MMMLVMMMMTSTFSAI